jgi:hypothetical protein
MAQKSQLTVDGDITHTSLFPLASVALQVKRRHLGEPLGA